MFGSVGETKERNGHMSAQKLQNSKKTNKKPCRFQCVCVRGGGGGGLPLTDLLSYDPTSHPARALEPTLPGRTGCWRVWDDQRPVGPGGEGGREEGRLGGADLEGRAGWSYWGSPSMLRWDHRLSLQSC